MDFDLSDEQRLLKDSVDRFVADRYDFETRKGVMKETDGWSRANWSAFAEQGLLGVPFAEEHGGFGGGPVETMLIMEAFGRGLVLEPYMATVVLGGGLLRHGGSAVVLAWYPGEEGGNAVADVVFGKVSPSGKLPITFPQSLAQLPAYEDYHMAGRTYRYLAAEPMYPFGYGLSYGKFAYSAIKLSATKTAKNKPVELTASVTNTGSMASDEVVQLYLTHPPKAGAQTPFFALKGFQHVRLAPGASTTVKFTLTPDMLALVNAQGQSVAPSGPITVWVGGSLPSARSLALGAPQPASVVLTVK